MSGRRSSNWDGSPSGMGGGVAVRYLVPMEKFDANFANQDGDGVLILGAQDAEIGRGGLGVLQGIGRFDDGDLIGDAGLVLRLGVGERLLIRLDGIVVEFFQRVLAA